MSQNPLNDLAGRLNKAPKGVGIGMKLLALGGAAAYGISQSMYTGNLVASTFITDVKRKQMNNWNILRELEAVLYDKPISCRYRVRYIHILFHRFFLWKDCRP